MVSSVCHFSPFLFFLFFFPTFPWPNPLAQIFLDMSSSADSSSPYSKALQRVFDLASSRHSELRTIPTIAPPVSLSRGIQVLQNDLPQEGWGLDKTVQYLFEEVLPTLAPGQNSTRYFGFVTGGTTPISQLADFMTTIFDSNIQVHLPVSLSCLPRPSFEDPSLTFLSLAPTRTERDFIDSHRGPHRHASSETPFSTGLQVHGNHNYWSNLFQHSRLSLRSRECLERSSFQTWSNRLQLLRRGILRGHSTYQHLCSLRSCFDQEECSFSRHWKI